MAVVIATFLVITATAAIAWHPEGNGSQYCDTKTGNRYVTWSVSYPTEDWSTDDAPMHIKSNSRNAKFDKTVLKPGEPAAKATEQVTGIPGDTFENIVKVFWKDGKGKIIEPQSIKLKVTLTGECKPPVVLPTITHKEIPACGHVRYEVSSSGGNALSTVVLTSSIKGELINELMGHAEGIAVKYDLKQGGTDHLVLKQANERGELQVIDEYDVTIKPLSACQEKPPAKPKPPVVEQPRPQQPVLVSNPTPQANKAEELPFTGAAEIIAEIIAVILLLGIGAEILRRTSDVRHSRV